MSTTTVTHLHEGAALTDAFDNQAEDYEFCVGAATRRVAYQVAKLDILKSLPNDALVCDNACGTGAITEYLLKNYPDINVQATDNSGGMVKIVDKLVASNNWQHRVKTQVMNSSALDFPENTFDAHIMNFGIFFTPDEKETAVRIRKTTKKGGPMILTCWKDSAVLSLLFEVQSIIKPAQPFDSLPVFGRWGKRETMESLLRSAGFENVTMQECHVAMERPTLPELMRCLLTTMKGFIGNRWTEEEKSQIPEVTKAILEAKRSEYLTIDTAESKGVDWVAWIATTHK